MSILRALSPFRRIATALERIATAMEQMLHDAGGQFDEERITQAVDERIALMDRQREARVAKSHEGYANMGPMTDASIREQIGLQASDGSVGSRRFAHRVGSLFGQFFRDAGASR